MSASTEPQPPQRDRAQAQASWSREPEGDSTLESNWLITLRRERYRSRRSGIAHDFYVVHLADAVNVIALTPENRLILVEQFRAGSATESLEPPGGLLDPGEDPIQAGARELLEETGYAGDPPIVLGTVWACPSLLTSRITTILIRNARKVAEPNCDEGEELRLHLVPSREVPALIRNGKIGHALAIQGLLWWLVSELPGTPLQQPEVYQAKDRQLGLRTVMGIVAVFALAFGLMRTLGETGTLLILPVLLLVPAYVLVVRFVDPMPKTVLTRSMARLGRRSLIRALATLAVTQVLWISVALIARLLNLV
ncbi:NUDIX hydrolase [Tautonia rosea]|uniref:NUDIX hydrolase n=1 Tax=Tautonia rosea TaxID=2728037 RepID=UPI001475D2BD|nr:NUDIX hydrolase [Tautonia rosea]